MSRYPLSGRHEPAQRRHAEPGLARHQGTGEYLRPIPEGQGMGRTGLPALPARLRLRRCPQHPAPRRAAVPRSHPHVVGQAPTICTKQKALQKQWEKALENIEELEKEPSISWPEAPRHAPAKGNNTEQIYQPYPWHNIKSFTFFLNSFRLPRAA